MPSLRSRLLFLFMKHQYLLKFRLKPEPIDWTQHEAIIRFREQCEEGARRFGKLPADLQVEPLMIDTLRAEWLVPAQGTKDSVLFFVHGGGYVSGSCSDHRIHAAKFVEGTKMAALLYDYRLAPEHVFPAALDDSVQAYGWLLAQGISPARIVFVGDSAGGGLCLATLLALRDRGIALPAAAVALSPWTDLTCSGESYRSNARTCLSPTGTWTAFSTHYVGSANPTTPGISPLFGQLHDLPPLFISAGGNEILRDDAIAFATKARAAGVQVTLRVEEGLFHCYPVCAPLIPEATQTMREICAFIRRQVARAMAGARPEMPYQLV